MLLTHHSWQVPLNVVVTPHKTTKGSRTGHARANPGLMKFVKAKLGLSKSVQSPMSRPQCFVSGAVALVLFISRVVGMAPLSFKQQHDGWIINVSPSAYIYSIIVIIFPASMGIAGVILDLNIDPNRAVRMRTPTKRIAWIGDYGVVMLTVIIGAFEGHSRLNKIIRYLNELQKINKDINIQPPASMEKRRVIGVVSGILSFLVITMFDAWTISNELNNYNSKRDQSIVYLYLSYDYLYMAMIILAYQFVVGAMIVYSTLKNLNDALENLSYFPESQEYYKLQHTNTTDDIIRHLALSYSDICHVVTEVTQCHGKHLLFMIASIVVHLVVTPYYISLAFHYSEVQIEAIGLLVMWCIAHFCSLVLIVEPCHWTQEELKRTNILVSLLMDRILVVDDVLNLELDEFYKQLTLNKIAFSPLGICTLARPLCASIMGLLTTYLVIMFQFQTSDDKIDGF
ncbi:gustatory receptor for sugar taste 43a-like [Aphomia sociella]